MRRWIPALGLAAAVATAEAFSAPALGGLRPSIGQRAIGRAPTLRVRAGRALNMNTATLGGSGRFPDSAPSTKRLTPANAGMCACAKESSGMQQFFLVQSILSVLLRPLELVLTTARTHARTQMYAIIPNTTAAEMLDQVRSLNRTCCSVCYAVAHFGPD